MNEKTEIIHEYDLSGENTVRFVASDFQGRTYYHIREYYQGYPTKKGISFSLDKFPDFTEGIVKLKEYIERNTSKNTN